MTPEENLRLEYLSRYERAAYEQGANYIAGIDEAGRGPWAGPVAAGAVILPPGYKLEAINDSKQLSEKKRLELTAKIKAEAVDWAVALVSPQYIDRYNILEATKQAMKLAIQALKPQPDFLLIDAVKLSDICIERKSLVKGDANSISIAAASILAKVTRDEAMKNYEQIYAGYGFAQHKGYGTKQHQNRLSTLGVCPIHRKSFRPVQMRLEQLNN